MDAEPWRYPFALDAFRKVQRAFLLTDEEILGGKDKIAHAARIAIVFRLRKEGRSRSECALAIGRRDTGRTMAKLLQSVRNYARDPELRPFFVAATEAP